jgi:hypothetical protein
MDAAASRRCAHVRTVKPCGPVPSMLGSSCAKRFARRRWLTSPTHRGERGAAVKPLRRECRSDFGVPVLACVRLLHARQWVRRAPGIPCALFLLRDMRMMLTRTQSAPRECGGASWSLRGAVVRRSSKSEGGSDEAIHRAASGEMDCFASLAMTRSHYAAGAACCMRWKRSTCCAVEGRSRS